MLLVVEFSELVGPRAVELQNIAVSIPSLRIRVNC